MAGQTTTGTVEWLSHCFVLTYHFNLDDNPFILTHTFLYSIYLCYIMPAFDVEALTDKPLPILLFTTTLHFESKIGKSLSVRASIPK
jgi:hypothetical protein